MERTPNRLPRSLLINQSATNRSRGFFFRPLGSISSGQHRIHDDSDSFMNGKVNGGTENEAGAEMTEWHLGFRRISDFNPTTRMRSYSEGVAAVAKRLVCWTLAKRLIFRYSCRSHKREGYYVLPGVLVVALCMTFLIPCEL